MGDNVNKEITEKLLQLGKIESSKGQVHKAKAYRVAVQSLAKHPTKIASGADARKLPGVGQKIAEKIDEILSTGALGTLERQNNDPVVRALQLLMRVSGIGPVKARELATVNKVRTLEDLRALPDSMWNGHQRIGIRLFEDFELRIPRAEMTRMETYCIETVHRDVDAKLVMKVAGSYRRGAATSGDIDFLVSHPDYVDSIEEGDFVRRIAECLHKDGFLTDDLSMGKTKYMGVGMLADAEPKVHRRVDIRVVPHRSFYPALVYFTGSDDFNVAMRKTALERGFTVNEYSIRPLGVTGVPGEPIHAMSEEEMFAIAGTPFKLPEERNL